MAGMDSRRLPAWNEPGRCAVALVFEPPLQRSRRRDPVLVRCANRMTAAPGCAASFVHPRSIHAWQDTRQHARGLRLDVPRGLVSLRRALEVVAPGHEGARMTLTVVGASLALLCPDCPPARAARTMFFSLDFWRNLLTALAPFGVTLVVRSVSSRASKGSSDANEV
jgi:hypothetical protein